MPPKRAPRPFTTLLRKNWPLSFPRQAKMTEVAMTHTLAEATRRREHAATLYPAKQKFHGFVTPQHEKPRISPKRQEFAHASSAARAVSSTHDFHGAEHHSIPRLAGRSPLSESSAYRRTLTFRPDDRRSLGRQSRADDSRACARLFRRKCPFATDAGRRARRCAFTVAILYRIEPCSLSSRAAYYAMLLLASFRHCAALLAPQNWPFLSLQTGFSSRALHYDFRRFLDGP